jgi:hypothetical protein
LIYFFFVGMFWVHNAHSVHAGHATTLLNGNKLFVWRDDSLLVVTIHCAT